MTLYSPETERQLQLVKERLAIDESQSWGAIAGNAVVTLGPAKLWFLALLVTIGFVLCIRRSWSTRYRIVWSLCAVVPVLAMTLFQLRTVAFVALRPIEIYEGPSKVFASGRALTAGARVLGTIENQWVKVSDGNGQFSWLAREQVALNAGWLWGQ